MLCIGAVQSDQGLIKGKLSELTASKVQKPQKFVLSVAVASESGMRRRFRSVDPRRQIDGCVNSRLQTSPRVLTARQPAGRDLKEIWTTRALSVSARTAWAWPWKLKVFSNSMICGLTAIFSEAAGASRLAHRQGGHRGK